MTDVEMTLKSKPLTKRDVAKFIGGKMAGWGSMIVTDSFMLQFGLPMAKAFKHSKIASASIFMATLAVSYKVGSKTEEYADEFIDDLCDCIVMIDDFYKEVKKTKDSATKEEAHEEMSSMTAERMA